MVPDFGAQTLGNMRSQKSNDPGKMTGNSHNHCPLNPSEFMTDGGILCQERAPLHWPWAQGTP